MPTLQEAGNVPSLSVATAGQEIESLLAREWLLTNGRGSYASSTIAGCNTRGYHGLLIGSLQPPVNRIMALAGCLETVTSKGKTFELSTFEFADKFAPEGFRLLKRFRRDLGAHFDYEFDGAELTKSIYLLRDTDTVAIVYDFTLVQGPLEFISRPFVGLRDFHTLQTSHKPLRSKWLGSASRGLLVRHDTASTGSLLLRCPSAHFEKDPQWWFNFVYRVERERGQNFTEDLWTPGSFKCRIEAPAKIVLWASLHPDAPGSGYDKPVQTDIDAVCRDLRQYQENLLDSRYRILDARPGGSLKAEGFGDGQYRASSIENQESRLLCTAADQFVVKRQTNGGHTTSILAGYPWFADWGRDALIALPGLLLVTGRFDEARSVLTTFAAAADEGMIPNHFDDNGDTAHFNSVDASLWFINAAFQYLQATGDSATFTQELLPTIRWIIDSYSKGTRFGIHADADGLIAAGDENTQLTWMDAKCDGVAFTPRYGKAVEVNALWYNALMLMETLEHGGAEPHPTIPNAAKVRSSFCELFWNERKGHLNDCILPDGSADQSLRPNQIFAVSLRFSPLSAEQQAAVVAAVQDKLLTPYGLRTLSPDAPGYIGRYTGPLRQRDEAYHQGTVWPYLIGPFVEAYLKVNDFSPRSRKQAVQFIEPLLAHLTETGCLGSISEIFDGDPPHQPKGCFAQAWSVAELIRACHLILYYETADGRR
ncbi:MAG TPA: amylo-alpha-1,6-glucosidase [Sedimentisphaerales bacterium]|nr:amylo-alpha-1,6-glucosidase [Sedimentisphaerales bacterium]